MLLVLILDLQVQVLLQLHRLRRQLLVATCCAALLSHGCLRSQQRVLELILRDVVSVDCLRFQEAFELLMLPWSEVFLLGPVALRRRVAPRRPAEAARLADFALLLVHVTPILIQIVVDAWAVQMF